LVSGPSNGSLSFNLDGSFFYTPEADFFGNDSFSYSVNDGQLNSKVATVSLEINSLNDAPIINSSPLVNATQGTVYDYTLAYTDVDSADSLTLSSSTLPSWLQFDTTTGVLSGIPTISDVGIHDVTLTVTDDGVGSLADSQTFTITVNPTAIYYEWQSQSIFDSQDDLIFSKNVTDSVTMSDVMGALSLAAGSNPNVSNKPISPYQLMAADIDKSGIVTALDALSILKFAAGVDDPEWTFVDESFDFGWNDSSKMFEKISLNNIDWDAVDASVSNNGGNKVAVLQGDVDASWVAPDLQNTLGRYYFDGLNTNGIPYEQFGIVI